MNSGHLFESLKKIRNSPSLMRKVKIFVGVSLVGLVLLGVGGVFLAVSAVKYVAGVATPERISQTAQTLSQTAQGLVEKAEGIPALGLNADQNLSDLATTTLGMTPNCKQAAVNVFNLQKLVSTPLKETYDSVVKSCFAESAEKPQSEKI